MGTYILREFTDIFGGLMHSCDSGFEHLLFVCGHLRGAETVFEFENAIINL